MKSAFSLIVTIVSLVILQGIFPTLADARRSSAEVSDVVDPAYKDSQFYRMLVVAPGATLFMRQQLERRTIKYLQKYSDNNVQADAFVDVFPPTRDTTDKEIQAYVKANRVDSVLFIDITGSNLDSWLSGFSIHNWGNWSSATPHYQTRRDTYARAALVDIATGNRAWIGSVHIIARGYRTSEKHAAAYVAKHVAARLSKNRLLAKTPRQEAPEETEKVPTSPTVVPASKDELNI